MSSSIASTAQVTIAADVRLLRVASTSQNGEGPSNALKDKTCSTANAKKWNATTSQPSIAKEPKSSNGHLLTPNDIVKSIGFTDGVPQEPPPKLGCSSLPRMYSHSIAYTERTKSLANNALKSCTISDGEKERV